MKFDPECQRCDRLRDFLATVRLTYPGYHARPVPSFGDPQARLLVVGLAPGMHGANATGRPFTGDHAGILLYQTLFDYGFANQPDGSRADDGLRLRDCRITNAVRCLPPQNKPLGAEIRQCNSYLAGELQALQPGAMVVALGAIAHNAVLRALGLRLVEFGFGHGTNYALPGERRLLSSYHCSRYNTQTRRLTPTMFASVFAQARSHIDQSGR